MYAVCWSIILFRENIFTKRRMPMISKVLYTEEIDDLDEAVRELFEQAEGFKFRENSLGVLITEEETDYPELYARISQKWDFPIIGCTTTAMINSSTGYCDSGISLMIMSADDCRFAVGAARTLRKENYLDEISRAYRPLSDSLNNEEKLIISYGVFLSSEDVSGDDLVRALDIAGKGVPVFGGLASDSFNYVNNRVFYNGEVLDNGQVFALVAGNIEPKCITVNSIENRANFSYEITKSGVNRIFKLGDYSFTDVLRKEQLLTGDKTEVMGDYLLSPFVVTIEQNDGEKIEVARNLFELNHKDGSGIFLGAMPEGSDLGIGIINREDVQASVEEAIERLIDKVSRSDLKYSTVLCTTCVARFLALASNIKAEANACCDRLQQDVSMVGMYAYGEFCPVTGRETGRDYNMFHNCTFTIVAI